jgi:hypothetical protein
MTSDEVCKSSPLKTDTPYFCSDVEKNFNEKKLIFEPLIY